MSRIAFLGLGAMGRRMAARLVPHHAVTVWNRTPGVEVPGATVASSPSAAVEGAELVFTMVTDDDAARAVWLGPEGALHGMRPGAIAIEVSTVTPRWITELAAAADDRGIHLLDAPVAGSTPQAEAGALAFLVGGADHVLDQVRPVLALLSKVQIHAGGQGRGAVLKLMVNALFAAQVAALAEVLQLAARHEVPADEAMRLLAPLPVTSAAAQGVGALMVAGDHASRFPVRLVEKDLRYAVAAGAGPVIEAARARYASAITEGHGDANLTVLHAL